jgi:hypothetical protein
MKDRIGILYFLSLKKIKMEQTLRQLYYTEADT